MKNTENKKIYEEAQNNFKENALDIIISHELGHQTHHQFLKKQESEGNWSIAKNGDICLTKTNKYNQEAILTTEFFKADNTNPNGIERFMQQNFMESYADCFSGLIVYLKNDSKDIFDKIKNFRVFGKNEIKDSYDLLIKNGQVLKGKFATTEYFNFHGIQKFRDNFINSFEKQDILNIAKSNFEAIHHIIQIESLDGLYKTMKEEAKNNNLFLLELNDFCQIRHNCPINTFFDKFESHLNNLRNIYCKYSSTNTLDNNEPYFDYDRKSDTLSQKDIIQEYRISLLKTDLDNFNKTNISKLNLNQFTENYGEQENKYISKVVDSFKVRDNILKLRKNSIGSKDIFKAKINDKSF